MRYVMDKSAVPCTTFVRYYFKVKFDFTIEMKLPDHNKNFSHSTPNAVTYIHNVM